MPDHPDAHTRIQARHLAAGLAFVLLSSGAGSLVEAQTNDAVFGSWRWAPDSPGSRPAGLGGAFVAVADGLKAAYSNPAGLSLIPVSEVDVSSGRPWLGIGRRFNRISLAGYLAQTDEQTVAAEAPDASSLLAGSVREVGLSIAAEPFPRVMLGATVARSRLHLEHETSTLSAGAGPTLSADDTGTRVTIGALVKLVGSRTLPSLRMGLSYQPGFDWSVPSNVIAGAETAAGAIAVRRPSVVAAGLAWRGSDRWSFSLQGDFIRYSEVVDSLRRNVGDAADGFGLPDTVEPRLGSEFSAPLWCGCGIVKARAGLHYRSPGTLRYSGADPATREAFGNQPWRTVASLGGSLLAEHFGNALRLDLDSKDLFDGPAFSFGIVWRF